MSRRTLLQKLARRFGYELRPIRAEAIKPKPAEISLRRYWHRPRNETPVVLYEADSAFHEVYGRAMLATQMTTDPPLRRQRSYVLTQLLKAAPLEGGAVAEAGCWRGLSAYQTALHIRARMSSPVAYHVIDSFEGLSEFASEDHSSTDDYDPDELRARYACSLEQVQENLAAFDFITYHKGWIPHCFHHAEQCRFSFVHIDVDLYEPIRDSFRFFYPRVIEGGIIVFDDYGYISMFPGARRAVDEILDELGLPQTCFALPSGQLVLIKGGRI